MSTAAAPLVTLNDIRKEVVRSRQLNVVSTVVSTLLLGGALGVGWSSLAAALDPQHTDGWRARTTAQMNRLETIVQELVPIANEVRGQRGLPPIHVPEIPVKNSGHPAATPQK